MESFKELGLPQKLLNSLEAMKFTTPTPIQAQAIPPALEGKDILGSAQTGTGKTGAFGIPLITRLYNNPRGSALVLTPTRELAMQVEAALKQMLGKYSTINTALLIGGESMPKQIQALRGRPRLIVGTPGRINDHLERGTLMLHDVSFLVLDETDRMLDMGFGIQIERLMKYMTAQRQTLLFSATLPPNIVKMSDKYLTDPVRVAVGSTTATATHVTQEIIHTTDAEKFDLLIQQLEARNSGSVVMFVKTKHGADRMAEKLRRQRFSAEAIHGDLAQNKRERVLGAFRAGKFRILVATDLASRGLDIPHIEHVINYDLPQCPEDYIHRIGRTGRAGASGESVCLITRADAEKWDAIQRLINPDYKPQRRERTGEGKPSDGKPRRNRNRNRSRGGNGNGNAQANANDNRKGQKREGANGNGNGNGRRRRRGGASRSASGAQAA